MRGIQSTWGDPDSFPELLSVTKADPNNFCFLHFTVSGGKSTVGRKKERKKNTSENNGIPSSVWRTQHGRTNITHFVPLVYQYLICV